MRSELALFGPEATRRFLGALYRSAPARSFVEVRFRMALGMGQCFHRAAALDRAAETILALASPRVPQLAERLEGPNPLGSRD